jgi:hypothetical protein
MAVTLGLNLSQELFRFTAYATSMLVFGLHGGGAVLGEFKLYYDSVYPEGQTWLPRGGTSALATAANPCLVSLETSQASCDGVESWAPLRMKVSAPHDPTRECFILQQQVDAVHSTHFDESSAEGEPTSPVLTVYIHVKVQVDLQADKSLVVVKGPFFPRVVNLRYRIRGTMCNARSNLISGKHFDLEKGFCI